MLTIPAQAPASTAPVLVTGAAGFIGFHVASRLLSDGTTVVGLDNLNDYYSVALKQARLAKLQQQANFRFERLDVANSVALRTLVDEVRPKVIVHLAAQVGVRSSVTNPEAYISANLVGFGNLLEAARHNQVEHLIYASSSSVYGANTTSPFSVEHNVDHPVSLYAATKKANELMAHSYSHLYGLSTTGLRFFTVYGPWGRPDMAVYRFTDAIEHGRPIQIYNHGDLKRDFTYVDDVVSAVVRLCKRPAQPDPTWSGEHPSPASSNAPYRVYNVGNSQPVALMEMIATLEKSLGKAATKQFLPMQPGDVAATAADVSALQRDIGFQPATPLGEGLEQFVRWYRAFNSENL